MLHKHSLDTPQRRMNWKLATDMWRDGEDTFDIATNFAVHEAFIYNFMPRGKKQRGDK